MVFYHSNITNKAKLPSPSVPSRPPAFVRLDRAVFLDYPTAGSRLDAPTSWLVGTQWCLLGGHQIPALSFPHFFLALAVLWKCSALRALKHCADPQLLSGHTDFPKAHPTIPSFSGLKIWWSDISVNWCLTYFVKCLSCFGGRVTQPFAYSCLFCRQG